MSRDRLILGIYTATIFLSATLLFIVQPMFARLALPSLGGSSAVWNTALVFYQVALLLGYTYAFALTRWLRLRQQLIVHVALVLLPLAVLPLSLPGHWEPDVDRPVQSLIVLLAASVGLPFLVVSTTSPLLQRWFVHTRHQHASDPYFLYSASNVGSLAALLGYPLVVERWLTLGAQTAWWTWGYIALVVLVMVSVAAVWVAAGRESSTATTPANTAVTSTWPQRLRWLGLSAVPVSLMLSVTTYLSTDLSAIPLLWVIPLSLYLTTFIVTFARRPIVPVSAVVRLVPFVLAGMALVIASKEEATSWWLVACHLGSFAIVALACHGRLAASRPSGESAAEFYLWLSLGGALGGLFNAIVAPWVFEHVVEYPLTLVLAALLLTRPVRAASASSQASGALRARVLDAALPIAAGALAIVLVTRLQTTDAPASWAVRLVMFGAPLLVAVLSASRPVRLAGAVAAVLVAGTFYNAGRGRLVYVDRTFFGINRVVLVPSGRYHVLGHGSTTHGAQSLDPARQREPLTYFHPNGPLGAIFAAFNARHPTGRVGVVGLGAGSIACYRRPDQRWTFYELDPAVVEIARDTGHFSLLRLCTPDADIVVGDARLSLEKAAPGAFDLLILDAYSSGAPPIHLITREALQLYLEKLAPGGWLVFNVSNRTLDFKSVLAHLARDAGLVYRQRDDLHVDPRLAGRGMMASQWAVLARDVDSLGWLAEDSSWTAPSPRPGTTVWTDDFNNLVSIIQW